MSFDATQASLTDVFRSLNVDPAEREALVRLAQKVSQLEHEREHQQMLFEAAEPEPAPVTGPRHKRPRHLRAVPPLAVLAPLGWAARWVVRTRAHKVVTAAVMTAVAGTATVTPALMMTAPAAPAPLAPSPHDRPPARPLHHHPGIAYLPPPAARRRAGHRHSRRHAQPAARPSPSPSGIPSPSPSPTDSDPSPSPSVTLGLGVHLPSEVASLLWQGIAGKGL